MRIIIAGVLAVTTLLASHAAAAEPPGLVAPTGHKNPRTALWLSLGTTAAGLALVVVAADIGIRPQAYPDVSPYLQPALASIGGAALLVGPSLGRIYGHGRLWNAGSALRLAGIGVFGLGFATVVATAPAPSRSNDGPGPLAVVGIAGVASAGLYAAGATYEIATTPRAVERYNREHGLEAAITMTGMTTRNGSVAPGLAIAGRF